MKYEPDMDYPEIFEERTKPFDDLECAGPIYHILNQDYPPPDPPYGMIDRDYPLPTADDFLPHLSNLLFNSGWMYTWKALARRGYVGESYLNYGLLPSLMMFHKQHGMVVAEVSFTHYETTVDTTQDYQLKAMRRMVQCGATAYVWAMINEKDRHEMLNVICPDWKTRMLCSLHSGHLPKKVYEDKRFTFLSPDYQGRTDEK